MASSKIDSPLRGDVKNSLCEYHKKGLFRHAFELQARDRNRVSINGRSLINFSSNDYLGLSSHPKILESINRAANIFGFGSSASPLVCGKTKIHGELERLLATRTGRDRALLFPSGYQANLGVIAALSRLPGSMFYLDRLCHASMVDGVVLSRAKFRRYNHADAASLEGLLKAADSKHKLVLTEAVFSMDGDVCPFDSLVPVINKYSANLIVDDAHGFGVMGNNGAGTLSQFQVGQHSAPLMIGTFGKAIGLQGAFVAGENDLIELLIQSARPYIYSTAMSIPLAAGTIESLHIIERESHRVQGLFERIYYFQKLCEDMGIKSQNTNTPIQPILIGDSRDVMRACEELQRRGFFVVGIRPPTVPEGTARIRISINVDHELSELEMLAESLAEVLKSGVEIND